MPISPLLRLATAASLSVAILPATAAWADPPASSWSALRGCESSGVYSINTGTGYYGAYQFDLPTWASVGGAGRPDLAAPAEQDYRALYLYRMRGWQPWTCARIRGLAEDGDARSGRVPSRAESAYMGGGTAAPTPPAPVPASPAPAGAPAWPGKVYTFGSCDPALRAWQLRMNAFGYSFVGTGCYGVKTRAAVLAVQRANGIKDSGILGPLTWAAAWHGRAPR